MNCGVTVMDSRVGLVDSRMRLLVDTNSNPASLRSWHPISIQGSARLRARLCPLKPPLTCSATCLPERSTTVPTLAVRTIGERRIFLWINACCYNYSDSYCLMLFLLNDHYHKSRLGKLPYSLCNFVIHQEALSYHPHRLLTIVLTHLEP